MRQLVVNGDYATTANCREKISPDIWKFSQYFEIFIYYPTNSRGIPPTTFCETLVGKH